MKLGKEVMLLNTTPLPYQLVSSNHITSASVMWYKQCRRTCIRNTFSLIQGCYKRMKKNTSESKAAYFILVTVGNELL